MKKTTQDTTSRARALQLWTSVRDELSERREVRAQDRVLQRELAAYTTRASVDDLLGTFEDEQGADADMIRSILANNLVQQRSHHLAS
jgi:hypothetical protein